MLQSSQHLYRAAHEPCASRETNALDATIPAVATDNLRGIDGHGVEIDGTDRQPVSRSASARQGVRRSQCPPPARAVSGRSCVYINMLFVFRRQDTLHQRPAIKSSGAQCCTAYFTAAAGCSDGTRCRPNTSICTRWYGGMTSTSHTGCVGLSMRNSRMRGDDGRSSA